MGVVDASPLHPAEGRQRGTQTSRRARPNRLEWAQVRGLDAWLHLLDMHRTQTNVDACVRHRRGRLKHCRRRLKLTPHTLTNAAEKPCRSTHAPTRLRGRSSATKQQLGGKNVPSVEVSLCGFLTDTTAETRGLLSGTARRVP
jgi:hypothetical protein